jgi:hypothetical protein
MGDWMDNEVDKFLPVFKKVIRGHYFEVSYEEA